MAIRIQSFLPRSRSKVVFVFVMASYCIAITYFIVAWRQAAHVQGPPPSLHWRTDPSGHVVVLLIVAPLFESLQLIGVFELARYAHERQTPQVLVAALVVSLAHVWPWWPKTIIVLPGFCIDAASYLYWRSRGSWKTAYVIAASIHALSNSIAALTALGHA